MKNISLTRKDNGESIYDRINNDPRIEVNVNDLTFTYNAKKGWAPVLKDVNLEIKGAQLVSILGPNGVGKSTFIHCMNKLLDPTEGIVCINDHPISEIPLKEMAKISGYVPYSASDSFPLTVTDTILMGRHPYSKIGSLDDDLRIVEETIKLIGIEDLADRLFTELSAGQRQKVMLSRGIAQQPRILFLDEPTSNLDIKYQLEITRMLRRLSRERNMLIIMISHDINIAAKYSDNILILLEGGIFAVGKPEEVITEDIIEKVYDVKVKVTSDGGRPHIMMVDDETFDDNGDFEISVDR